MLTHTTAVTRTSFLSHVLIIRDTFQKLMATEAFSLGYRRDIDTARCERKYRIVSTYN